MSSRLASYARRAAFRQPLISTCNVRRSQSTIPKPAVYDSRVFRVAEEVQEAVQSGKPVVALETTIYTHGFPYPDNVALASHLESVVRLNGAVPATIGLLDGVARVGMGAEEMIALTSSAGKKETMKVSRRDLAYIAGLGLAGRKLNGGTTISGTMILAQMAGIEIFGTGGLGGVHRGGENSMDVSADLTELGRTPVTVISSGCKSFLDLPRTLEYLETQGVCVGTFRDGREGPIDIPSFYTRESGIPSPTVIHDETEAAAIIYARRLLNVDSGLFLANPIPAEFSIPQSEINSVIDAAVREAAEKGFHGHANTPFILAKIKELTGGKSIPANRALIESNVKRAAKVAVELSKLSSGKTQSTFMPSQSVTTSASPGQTQASLPVMPSTEPVIIVAGSIAVDLSCDYISEQKHDTQRQIYDDVHDFDKDPLGISHTSSGSIPIQSDPSITPIPKTSNPASIQQSIGGVGHNVATAAHLTSAANRVRLCTYIADDLAGSLVLSSLESRGLDTTGVKILPASEARTAQYVSINDATKNLVLAMADMDIVGSASHDITPWTTMLASNPPKWLVVDGNWHAALLAKWTSAGKASGARIAFEPVSTSKSERLFPPRTLFQNSGIPQIRPYPNHRIDLATPNNIELLSMHAAAKQNEYFESAEWWNTIDSFGIPSTGARTQLTYLTSAESVDTGIPQMAIQLLPYIPNLTIKLGAQGVLVVRLLSAAHPALTDPKDATFILSRNANGSDTVGGVYMRLYPPADSVKAEEVVSVNGVGDTFLGVLIAGLARRGNGVDIDEQLISIAQRAAVMTLKSRESVAPGIGSLLDELAQWKK